MLVPYHDLRTLPFAYGGRYPAALDCFGLLLEIFRRNGIKLPDPFLHTGSDYGHEGNGQVADAVEHLFNFSGLWQRVECPHEGSVLVISRHGKTADHCGIALDNRFFIHEMHLVGLAVSPIRGVWWNERLRGIYDYVGPVPQS